MSKKCPRCQWYAKSSSFLRTKRETSSKRQQPLQLGIDSDTLIPILLIENCLTAASTTERPPLTPISFSFDSDLQTYSRGECKCAVLFTFPNSYRIIHGFLSMCPLRLHKRIWLPIYNNRYIMHFYLLEDQSAVHHFPCLSSMIHR
ncbi:hypothetical protein TNIN_290241 [Trichonephila inaurata madagascariensis]|uniref:Uncharacterized protein n=1 Tax=Trichonephila inaurata madagascariensis TaxID=2747483 RepID=A0A8X6X7G1_9ARAC|nr:hypothetical protein TNIN_290241 [Trichonephila inaurata madagascariensis]